MARALIKLFHMFSSAGQHMIENYVVHTAHASTPVTSVTSSQQPQRNDMLPLRAGTNLAPMFTRGAAARSVGRQLARRSYVTTAPVGRSILLYAGLAGAGIGLHAYGLNNIYCDSMRSISL